MIEPLITTPPAADAFKADDTNTAALPPKVRAWTLYCQGYHSPEIGHLLGIPERTVRSWLSRALSDLDAEHKELSAHHLTLAIARQRRIAAAAWQAYECALAIAEAESAKAATSDTAANARTATQALSVAARHLRLAAAADRELARLHDTLSHHYDAPTIAINTVEQPALAYQTDDRADLGLAGDPHHRFRDMPSSANLAPQPHETAAKTASAFVNSSGVMGSKIDIVAKTAIAHHEPRSAAHLTSAVAAKPATPSGSPSLFRGGGWGERSTTEIPAKTATPTQTPRRRIALRYVM